MSLGRWLIFDRNEDYRKLLAEILSAVNHEVYHFSDLLSASLVLRDFDQGAIHLVLCSNIGADQVPLVARQVLGNFINSKAIFLWENESEEQGYMLKSSELKSLGLTFSMVKQLPTEVFANRLMSLQAISHNISTNFSSQLMGDDSSEMGDDEFIQVELQHIIPDAPVLFDVYLRIREGRYVKILSAHDALSDERKNIYTSKGVDQVLIRKADRSLYVRQATQIHLDVLKAMDATLFSQAKASVNILEQIFHGIRDCGFYDEYLEHAELITQKMLKKIREDKDLMNYIETLQGIDPNLYYHSYLVSLFSLMILERFSWKTEGLRHELGIAALLHDVGKEILPPLVARKRPGELTNNQLKLYRRHPQLGAESLAVSSRVSTNVLVAIEQHHELMDGSGFPRGLTGPSIHILSRILGLCDHFVHFLADSEIQPQQAIKVFAQDPKESQRFCQDSLKFLRALA